VARNGDARITHAASLSQDTCLGGAPAEMAVKGDMWPKSLKSIIQPVQRTGQLKELTRNHKIDVNACVETPELEAVDAKAPATSIDKLQLALSRKQRERLARLRGRVIERLAGGKRIRRWYGIK
jgi:hypothetical protein